MISLVIFLTCLFIAIGVGLMAAWSDIRGLTIPNWHSAAIIIAFAVAFGLVKLLGPGDLFQTLLSHLVAVAVIFGITALLFSLKAIGAADSKLSTAFAFWVGVHGLPAFLFYMTLAGGVLGLVSIALGKWKPCKAPPRPGGWVARVQAGESKVPYGVAIVIGALASFVKLGYLGNGLISFLG